jgi:hypothetical protein
MREATRRFTAPVSPAPSAATTSGPARSDDYTPPRLTVHGGVAALTAAVGSKGIKDNPRRNNRTGF